MTKSFEIYLRDLTPEKQREVLDFFELDSAEDGNYDVFPIATLDYEPEIEEETKWTHTK